MHIAFTGTWGNAADHAAHHTAIADHVAATGDATLAAAHRALAAKYTAKAHGAPLIARTVAAAARYARAHGLTVAQVRGDVTMMAAALASYPVSQ